MDRSKHKATDGGEATDAQAPGNQGAPNAEEDQELPPLRAVAMMSSGPKLVETLGPTLKLPLPLRQFRPTIGSNPGTKPQSKSRSFEVKKEWSGVTVASAWNVKGEDLELVPTSYPLERTHREISNADASTVALRISSALASMSIEAEYDCEKAKAKCKTGDYVGFRIRLYAGGEGGLPVVVEVQRRCGSASSFMATCRVILLAAEGKESSSNSSCRASPFVTKPISEMMCLHPLMKKSRNYQEEAERALDNVVSMLRSDQLDSNLLGIENLACLTDPIKTSPSIALLVSKSVALMNDGKHDIREEIRLLTERDTFTADTFAHEKNTSTHQEQLRHFALMVFANSLSICAKEGVLGPAVKEQRWFTELLVPTLVDELKRVRSNACNAHHAAFCLSSLLSCSDVARRQLLEHGGRDVLQEAHAYGDTYHALLASETETCLKFLVSPH